MVRVTLHSLATLLERAYSLSTYWCSHHYIQWLWGGSLDRKKQVEELPRLLFDFDHD